MKAFIKTVLVFVSIYIFVGCGPYKEPLFVEIETNETAFLVPLEGANKAEQGKFMSLDYLEAAKVATKRIEIPQRAVDDGRMWWAYHYVPTMRVIKIDRSPVTREWTKNKETGTNTTDDALPVETVESINFGIGITITASIKEDDAATFLYWYSGKTLAHIMDTNIRGHMLSSCSADFGAITLDNARKEKALVISKAAKAATDYFATKGITIEAVGNSGGLVFADDIQTIINNSFIAEQNIIVENNKKLAQDKTNLKIKTMADTKLYEAQKFAAAQNATTALIQLEINKMNAEANLTFAKGLAEGKVQLPAQILPSNSPLLFNLGSGNK